MGRGGARKGAGRKAGAATKRTREVADKLMAEGLTPLEFMLGIMRGTIDYDEPRFKAAKEAAPYVHPRLVASKIESKLDLTLADLVAQSYRPDLTADEDVARH